MFFIYLFIYLFFAEPKMNRVSDLPFPFLITNQNKIKKKIKKNKNFENALEFRQKICH